MKNIYRNNKFFKAIIICFLISLVTFFTTSNNSVLVCAFELDDAVYNIENVSIENGDILTDEAYLSVHYSDGTMGMVLDETYVEDEVSVVSKTYEHLQKTTVMSSGRPDNQSIVAVFLGDGFTSSEQDEFLNRVEEIANYMITVEPFNYYKDYLTVYAVHCISNESGISGERNGKFACHDSSRNPATYQCTPNDGIFNCTHGNDTFFNGYYAWRASAGRVILEMTNSDRSRARNIAKEASSSVNMVQIIANSAMRGGTGQMPTSREPLGVALTSINTANVYSDWKEVVMHEFGHAFGGLWDEYWNGYTPSEYPNMTKNNNVNTVKWSSWIGYKNVGVYPFSSSEWDGNPNQSTDPWYRPHQNCRMRQTSNPFCSVCVQALLDKMANATGLQLFDISNIDENYIKISKMNLNMSGELIIPERINGRIVIIIGNEAFKNCINLEEIIIPNTVTNIGSSAFENCSYLQSVSLPTNLVAIGSSAFKGCESLESITIPNGVTNIDSSVFENCSYLQSVSLPANLVAIGSSAFKGCESLESITIPNGVTNIDSSVFENCSYLQSVSLPTNLVAIGSSAFKGCESLESITIPNGVTNIDSSVFENCSYLQSVSLPTNLVAIGSSAFKGCESLESITIPSNVEYIDESAFENCVSLVSVIVEREISNITNLGDYAFAGCSSTLQIIVPQNRVAEYKNKEYWSNYKNKIVPDDDTFVTHQLSCETNLSFNTNLESYKQKLYKIDVQCSNIYKFSFDSMSSYNINLYDSNFNIVYSSQSMFQMNLIQGIYYLEIKFNDENSTGNINTQIESTKLLYIGNNNILNRYFYNIEDYIYINNSSAGFYKITLNATNSSGTIEYPEGCIKVYADEAKQQKLARLETIFYTLDAETQGDSNNVIVFLEYGQLYYINIDFPSASYSSMYINVERLTNTYDIIESNTAEEHVILDENTTAYGDYIQRVEIHEAGTYTIIFTHEGPQSEENLMGQENPLYLYYAFYKEVYSPAEQFGDLEMIFPHIASSMGGTISFTFNLQPGVYYIGYYNKLNNEPMSISITS